MRNLILTGGQFRDLAEDILSREKSLVFRVNGFSMRPFIQDGDRLEIESVQPHQIRLGDVILYQAGGIRVIAHRVVGRLERNEKIIWLLQGDYVPQPDGWVESSQVIGRAITLQRGRHTYYLDSPHRKILSRGIALGLPLLKRLLV